MQAVQKEGVCGGEKRSNNGRFNELGQFKLKGQEGEKVCGGRVTVSKMQSEAERKRIGGGIQKKIGVGDGLAPSRDEGRGV